MKSYNQCVNIIIDGSEYTKGFLGLDWLPSSTSRLNEQRYEDWITYELNTIIKSWSGWSVLVEIFSKHRESRKMYIRPYNNQKEDPYNAYARALNPQAATLKGAPQLYCGDIKSTPENETGKPIPGAPTGTGTGSDVEVRYTPWIWKTGGGTPVGPGTDPDEILLHEMVHGLREMGGVSLCGTQINNYHTQEEFVAILVSNIYRSETKKPALRADHAGFSTLSPALSNPATFLNKYWTDISLMQGEHQNLFWELKGVKGIPFNPIALS